MTSKAKQPISKLIGSFRLMVQNTKMFEEVIGFSEMAICTMAATIPFVVYLIVKGEKIDGFGLFGMLFNFNEDEKEN